jgi:hypothetical protein
MEVFAFDNLFDRRTSVLRAEVGVERSLPHGNEEDHVALLAGVLLRDLHLEGLAGVLERGEERRYRFADLEVYGAVLDLDDDVGLELAVEGMEIVVASAGAVGLEIVPVEVVVVDETAIEDDATVRLESEGDDIGSFGWGASIFGWTDAAFGVGLDDEAGKVGDRFVNLVHLGLPPGCDGGVVGIEGGEMADDHGAGEIDGERHLYAPGAELIGDAGELDDHVGLEGAEVGVDVVDGGSVETDGGEQATVFGDAGEVGADVAVVVEDAAARIAALYGAVEVVPLVDPADGR